MIITKQSDQSSEMHTVQTSLDCFQTNSLFRVYNIGPSDIHLYGKNYFFKILG